MGGYNGGEVANKMATEAARDYIQKELCKKVKKAKNKLNNL